MFSRINSARLDSPLKVFAPVFFFLALALVSEAIVDDSSIVDEFDRCTSELRVKIRGTGLGAVVTVARMIAELTAQAAYINSREMIVRGCAG